MSFEDDNKSNASGGFDAISTDFQIIFPEIEKQFPSFFEEVTPREIILGESLLTPGLQTSVKFQSEVMLPADIRWWDTLKGTRVIIEIEKLGLENFGYNPRMNLSQIVYRLGGRSSSSPQSQDNRKMIGRTVEELVFHACDPTLLNDAQSLVSKIWKCTRPHEVAAQVLLQCAGVPSNRLDVESSEAPRDYKAENIHPFQVVSQQTNVALAGGNDPSFIHYMTYVGAESGFGTHHFRSLRGLIAQDRVNIKPLKNSLLR
jgi:hypothetical protein